MPERLIGYRIRLNRSWDDEDLEFEDRYHPEMSVSNVSTFSGTIDSSLANVMHWTKGVSETYQADHARVGSTSLGSIGRVGDRCTEPIHNPILLGIVAFFLIMSSPLILSVGQDGTCCVACRLNVAIAERRMRQARQVACRTGST